MTRFVVRGLVAALALLPAAALAQDGATITGRVTSTQGVPLQAVSVFVEGMNLGAMTREDGQYNFTIPAARVQGQQVTLRARLVGYRPAEQQVTLSAGTMTANFQMESSPLRLDEIVVTGQGTTTTAERLGHARNSVSDSLILRSQEPNIVQALAGKAPNVEVTQQSGEPGASSYIRIRGPKTIQGTGQPLFVVDGVPIDNSTLSTGSFLESTVATNRASDINPMDIESVEILKGAAAAAIYGARAANGVVLITTKQGIPGATRFNWRSSISRDEVNQSVPLQRRYGWGYGGDEIPGFALSYGPELTGPTFDHWGELFRTGSMIDNQLTISGGSERTTFYISGSRLDHQGVIVGPNNWYDRTTVRLKGTHRFRNELTLGGNVSYVDSRGAFIQKGSNLSGLLLGGLRTPPNFDNMPYLNEQGWHRSYRNANPTSRYGSRGYDNPFWTINEQTTRSTVGRAFGNITLDYVPLDWLQVKYTLGSDYANDQRVEALPPSSSNFPAGLINRADFTTYQLDHNLLVTGTTALTQTINGSLTLGQNLNSRRFNQNFVTGRTWIAPEGPISLNNTINLDPGEFNSLIHTESYFAQGTLDMWEQFFLTGSVRNDGFSTFGAAERRHWFPKASAAWTFTETLGSIPGIGQGKLRAAWGEAGREPNVYATVTAFSLANIGDGGWGPFLRPAMGGAGGVRSSTTLGQDQLRPERTREIEAGFDLGLLGDRADLGFTYYNALSRDVIFQLPLAPSTGFQFQARNGGRIRNEGLELQLNLRPYRTQNVQWDFGVNWATNRNRVLELEGVEFVDMPGAFAGAPGTAWQGYPVGVLRGFDFARCRYNQESNIVYGVDINADCRARNAPDGALWIDDGDIEGLPGFPITDPTTRVIMDPNPDWTGSLRSSIRLFGNLELSGLLDVRQGGQVWNGTRGALIYFGTHRDTENRYEQRIVGQNYMPGRDGASGVVTGPGVGETVTLDEDWYLWNGGGFGDVSSHFIEDGSFIKLREISVGYTLTRPFVRNTLGLGSIDLRIAGRNLRTWTDYTGIDPETNLAGAEVQLRGIDYFNNPQTRSIVFTIGLNR